jgi:hypothetical protein
MYRIFLALLLAVVLLSCSSPTSNDNTLTPFSLKIILKDADQQPLSHYIVGIYPPNLTYQPQNRASTTIRFSLAESYHVKLDIQDYFGNHECNLVDQTLVPGLHQVLWNGHDEDCNAVKIDGLYQCRIEYFNGAQSVFKDSVYAYKLEGFNDAQAPYETDDNGQCLITNKLPFPILYCNQEVMNTDESNNELGSIDFSDQFEIYVCLTDDSGQLIAERDKIFTIHDGENILNLNWATMDRTSAIPTNKLTENTKAVPVNNVMKNTKDVINKLYPVYPNPFN